LSLKAGGTGLNLTAAQNVVHFDLWWNPAVEAQATDRAYRIGQTKNVMVHRLITRGTFEEKINDMLKDKRELADLTVAAGEKWIGDYSNKDLREIFALG
jgi:SNF2 family DNA or RNA helicase